MTARAELAAGRASTGETSCSSCSSLVLRLCGAELRGQPTCSSCDRVVCSACELDGRCVSCFAERYLAGQPAEQR